MTASRRIAIVALLLFAAGGVALAEPADDEPTSGGAKLPAQTSRYNRGNQPGRYRDAKKKLIYFVLKRGQASIYDGAGREIGKVTKPVLLNSGAAKDMDVDHSGTKQSFAWAWATEAGSGWIARSELANPPKPDIDPTRNPRPPRDSDQRLVIDAPTGRKKLEGLRFMNSQGTIKPSGNHGADYGGRHPGNADYIYLCFACPNVIRGGMARDSLADGSRFVPALDEKAKPIVEVMTMYRDADMKKPVRVTFLYGRGDDGDLYGWIARANVGDL
jgi:hypothetical protein